MAMGFSESNRQMAGSWWMDGGISEGDGSPNGIGRDIKKSLDLAGLAWISAAAKAMAGKPGIFYGFLSGHGVMDGDIFFTLGIGWFHLENGRFSPSFWFNLFRQAKG